MLNNLTNFINLIATRMVKTVLEDGDLFVVGTRDRKYDGGYKPTIATVSAVANAVAPLIPPSGSYGLFSQTSSSTPVANTTAAGSLIGTGVGVLSIPANAFQVGDSFRAKFAGKLSAKNNSTLRIVVKADSVTLADTGIISMPAVTDLNWILEIDFTIRTLGIAGVASIESAGTFLYMKNASNAFEGDSFSVLNNTTFDTTIINTLEVTAQWGSADPLDSISSDLFTLTKTF